MSVIKHGRRRLAPEDRRIQIKEAGIFVFAEKGYQATSVSDIVARAGAAQGTFYLYFEGKKALFLELMDDFAERIRASFDPRELDEEALGKIDAASIASLLEDGYRRYFRLCQDNLALVRVFFQETVVVDRDFRQRRQAIYEEIARHIRWYLDEGVARGLLRPMATEVAAHCIVGMVERVTIQWLVANDDPPLDMLAAELAGFETFGIAPRPTDAGGAGKEEEP